MYNVEWQTGRSGDTMFLLRRHVPPLRQRKSSLYAPITAPLPPRPSHRARASPNCRSGGGWGGGMGVGGDRRRGVGCWGLGGRRGWCGRGGVTASGRGTGPRNARTSPQRVGVGCVACVRRGGRRFSLADFLGCTALSRDRVCSFTPPISRCAPRFSHCIRRFGAAHQMTNKIETNRSIWKADKCTMRLRNCMARCFIGAPVCHAKWPLGRLRGYPRRVGVASKSPRCNQNKRKGRTADDATGP